MTKPKQKEPVRISLELSRDWHNRLEEIAQIMHGSKSDVLRRAFGLLDYAVERRCQGKHLAVVDANGKVETEIIGFGFGLGE